MIQNVLCSWDMKCKSVIILFSLKIISPQASPIQEKRLLVKGDDKVLPLHCFCFWYERSCYPFKWFFGDFHCWRIIISRSGWRSIIEEDWHQFINQFPVKIEFRNSSNQKVTHFEAGGRIDLVISLPDGYQIGDLVHVALPACLSWIQGGGKVKRFRWKMPSKCLPFLKRVIDIE